MGVTTKWFNEEHSAIHHIYEGRWTWEEMYAILDEAVEMLETVDHMVDLIADMQNASLLPSGTVGQFNRIRGLLNHPQVGSVIVVGASRLVQTFAEVFKKVSPNLQQEILFASDLTEVDAILQKKQAG
jgi:hypothetical protein